MCSKCTIYTRFEASFLIPILTGSGVLAFHCDYTLFFVKCWIIRNNAPSSLCIYRRNCMCIIHDVVA